MNIDNLLNSLKNIRPSTFNSRPFWISMIGGFAMAYFQNLGYSPSFFSPIPERQIAQASDTITPLLEKVPNTIQLTEKIGTSPLQIEAKAYIVVDMDSHEILAEKNAHDSTSVASLTKVLSAVVTLDLADVNEQFTITDHAAGIVPTKIGVVPGEKMKVSELMHAMLLTSANDATEALREGIDTKYGGEVFIDAMNQKADFIGMKNSKFQNPQGFDARSHYSTPYDLALLSLYAMENYPEIAEIAQKDYAFLPDNINHKQFDLHNWNGLIGVYPNTFGLKTGVTENAGNTTIVMAERDGKKILVVLLGATSIVDRDLTAVQLLNAGFEEAQLKPFAVDEMMLQERYGRWEFWN